MKTFRTMLKIEGKLSIRDMNMVIFALLMPVTLGWFPVLISMLSIGMFVGGIAKNTQQASLIACILYFPMLIFSGATLPYEIMPKALQILADLMPLTQGIKLLKNIVLGLPLENIFIPISILISVSVVFITLSLKLFRWE